MSGLIVCMWLPGARAEDRVRVPGGEFTLGCDTPTAECESDEQPARRLRLAAFYIDRTEVTVAAYRLCVTAGACQLPAEDEGCNWGKPGRDDHPVNCVDWHQAEAFCAWRGGRLPTEAEWERAARGSDGRTYPWGEASPDCSRAQMAGPEAGCGKWATAAVCSRPVGNSPTGLCDTAGNVWEWVADWYSTVGPGPDGARDPRGPTAGTHRVQRGGSFYATARYLRVTNRDLARPTSRQDALGFRCAYDALTPGEP